MSSERISALLAKLGATDAAARELIEVGEPALAAVDAVVADTTRPNHVRMTASKVAHHIRDRMMRAPAPPARTTGDDEARAWLERHGRFGGDAFQRHDAHAFVDALYAAGAARVLIVERGSVMLAELPADIAARARLFAIYNAEVDELGEEFGGEETPGHEMTADEAAVIGHPEAAGEWVVDDLHAHDTGQPVLRFWWD